VLRHIHTMRRRYGDRSAGGSVPSPSQLDRARTRFSTKIGSITSNLRQVTSRIMRRCSQLPSGTQKGLSESIQSRTVLHIDYRLYQSTVK